MPGHQVSHSRGVRITLGRSSTYATVQMDHPSNSTPSMRYRTDPILVLDLAATMAGWLPKRQSADLDCHSGISGILPHPVPRYRTVRLLTWCMELLDHDPFNVR
jgi:hypothetical protein